MKQFTTLQFPRFENGEYTEIGASTVTSKGTTDTYSLQPYFNWLKGRHVLKFGSEMRRYNRNTVGPGVASGRYVFNKAFSQANPLTGDSTSGDEWASFMMGYPASGTVDSNIDPAYRWHYFAFYLQDDFKLSRKLTLNLGDVRLPDGNGLELLPEIRKNESSPEVIILTGFADADGAELAIKSGAWDYLQKPVSLQELELLLNRVLQYRDNLRMVQKPSVALSLPGIVGNSPHMKACLDVLAHAANTDANVLITGETGTGKELFARAIHHNSRTCKGDFVVVDCTALPETLVESILFGYEKGAFTGAEKSREGLVQQANGGTLWSSSRATASRRFASWPRWRWASSTISSDWFRHRPASARSRRLPSSSSRLVATT